VIVLLKETVRAEIVRTAAVAVDAPVAAEVAVDAAVVAVDAVAADAAGRAVAVVEDTRTSLPPIHADFNG
jgi:hypothetical protein